MRLLLAATVISAAACGAAPPFTGRGTLDPAHLHDRRRSHPDDAVVPARRRDRARRDARHQCGQVRGSWEPAGIHVSMRHDDEGPERRRHLALQLQAHELHRRWISNAPVVAAPVRRARRTAPPSTRCRARSVVPCNRASLTLRPRPGSPDTRDRQRPCGSPSCD